MRTSNFLTGILLLTTYFGHGQFIDKELQQKLVGKTKLPAIMQVVDDFYKEDYKRWKVKKNNSKGQGEVVEDRYLHWKRWEWYMQNRLDKDGNFVNIVEKMLPVYEQQKNLVNTNSLTGSTTASWSLIGPLSSITGSNINQINGLGRADRIVFHPTDANTMYLGTPCGGLWKTIDGGISWSAVGGFLPGLAVSGIVVDNQNPNTIYVLTGDGNSDLGGNGLVEGFGYKRASAGIFRSNDGGVSFERLPPLPTTVANYYGYKLMQDPAFNNVLYAATSNGLFRSADFGNTFTRVISGRVFDIEFKPGNSGTVYASSAGGVEISTNFGVSFSTVAAFNFSVAGCDRIEIAVTPNDADVVYALAGKVTAAGVFTGVFRSTNSGVNFTRQCNTPNILGNATNGSDNVEQNRYNLGIAVAPGNQSTVITAGTTVWRSTNEGINFQFATCYNESGGTAVQYIHPDVHDVAFNPLNGWLYAATDGGIYRSTTNGVSWQDLSGGISITQPYHMAGFNGNPTPILIGNQDNGIKSRRINGQVMEHIWGGDGFDVAYNPVNATSYYVTSNGGIRNIRRNGAAFFGTNPANISMLPPVAAHPTDSNTVYVGSANRVFKSSDAAATWTTYTSVSGAASVATCPANGNRVYAAGNASLWRTDNGGANWSANLAAALPLAAITDVNTCPANSDIVWLTNGGFTEGEKVYYSTNAGATWQNLSGTLPNMPVNCIYVDAANNAYIGTDAGVYYQAADKTDWTPYYNGLPKVPVTDIFATNGMVRAATFGRGIWEIPVYTACDATITLTADIQGPKFYQTSNTLSSSAKIVGGAGTEVIFKAGNDVALTDGFTITENNMLRVINGPCDAGGVPTINTRQIAKPVIPVFATIQLPKGELTQFPYGYISVSNVVNNQVEVLVNKILMGRYEIRLVDKDGGEVEFPKLSLASEIATERRYVELPQLASGMYYIQLYFNGELVHFQELHF